MTVRRRDLLLATGAVAWLPPIATAQAKLWRIAIMDTAALELNRVNFDTFRTRLRELGYAEGQNLLLEYRSTDGRNERLPTLVSGVIRFRPDVIVVRGTPEIIAVAKATRTIPVVMSAVADPVGAGVAASLARPGGNITGLASTPTEIETKRVQHLAEVVPNLRNSPTLRARRRNACARS